MLLQFDFKCKYLLLLLLHQSSHVIHSHSPLVVFLLLEELTLLYLKPNVFGLGFPFLVDCCHSLKLFLVFTLLLLCIEDFLLEDGEVAEGLSQLDRLRIVLLLDGLFISFQPLNFDTEVIVQLLVVPNGFVGVPELLGALLIVLLVLVDLRLEAAYALLEVLELCLQRVDLRCRCQCLLLELSLHQAQLLYGRYLLLAALKRVLSQLRKVR